MALSPEQIQNFARQRLQLQQKTDVDRGRLNQDLGINTRLLQEAGARGQKQVGDQLASQGLFNSGIRVNEQGQIVREMNEGLGELNLNTSRTLQDLESGLAGGLADINFQEQQATAEAQRLEAERAQQRAAMEAQARAAASGGPRYPQPVLNIPAFASGSAGVGGAKTYQTPAGPATSVFGNQGGILGYRDAPDWQTFAAYNPQMAQSLLSQFGGNVFTAAAHAISKGYIKQPPAPTRGQSGRAF